LEEAHESHRYTRYKSSGGRREELTALLDTHLVEKAISELGYELNNRPGWVRIPLQGIQQGPQAVT